MTTARTTDELAAALYGTSTPAATSAPAQGPASVARPRTEAELGAAMYGPGGSMQAAQPLANTDTTDTSKPQTHEHRSQEQLADALYAPEELPEAEAPADPEMLALRESPERRLYGLAEAAKALPLSDFLDEVGQEIAPGVTLTKEHVAKGVAELRAMAADLNLVRSDVNDIGRAIERFKGIDRTDRAVIAAEHDAAIDALNTAFGNEAALALRAAQAYVSKNPRLAAFLNATGAGDDARTVALIAQRALAMHKAGKLTLTPRSK